VLRRVLRIAGRREASLYVVTRRAAAFGAPSTLVPASGQNNYYPSYSPDGAWVAFNRASIALMRRVMRRARTTRPMRAFGRCRRKGGTPISLARTGSPNGDSWPKWMQRDQKYRGKKLMWITFSSRPRNTAFAPTRQERAGVDGAAFDPEAASAGRTLRFAAFWLPFQELDERQPPSRSG